MRTLLALCMCLAACGGTTTTIDGGSDATTDGTIGFDAASCTQNGLVQCGAACVNIKNDPTNCGACGVACSGGSSMCLNGTCAAPTCAPACGGGQQCCEIFGPGPSGPPQCEDGGTCPVGCPLCK